MESAIQEIIEDLNHFAPTGASRRRHSPSKRIPKSVAHVIIDDGQDISDVDDCNSWVLTDGWSMEGSSRVGRCKKTFKYKDDKYERWNAEAKQMIFLDCVAIPELPESVTHLVLNRSRVGAVPEHVTHLAVFALPGEEPLQVPPNVKELLVAGECRVAGCEGVERLEIVAHEWSQPLPPALKNLGCSDCSVPALPSSLEVVRMYRCLSFPQQWPDGAKLYFMRAVPQQLPSNVRMLGFGDCEMLPELPGSVPELCFSGVEVVALPEGPWRIVLPNQDIWSQIPQSCTTLGIINHSDHPEIPPQVKTVELLYCWQKHVRVTLPSTVETLIFKRCWHGNIPKHVQVITLRNFKEARYSKSKLLKWREAHILELENCPGLEPLLADAE